MKKGINIVMVATIGVALMACGNRALEKRIAELESRMTQLEKGNGTNNNQANQTTPADNPTAQPAAQEQKPEGPLPVLEFETMDHDFGTINEGQKVSYTYKLKNTGQAPLIIQSAAPSCGCTVPKWSQEPIPVGGIGYVTAEFDSSNKPGINNKSITVTANTWPKTTMLRFKAMVTPKAGGNGPTK